MEKNVSQKSEDDIRSPTISGRTQKDFKVYQRSKKSQSQKSEKKSEQPADQNVKRDLKLKSNNERPNIQLDQDSNMRTQSPKDQK